MTTENTNAATRVIRKLTAQLDEERASRGAAERRLVEQGERMVSLDEELSAAHSRIAEMDDRIERALEALRNGLPVRDILTEGFDS